MRAPTLQISIVTPSYNQAAYLEEALLSVKSQNHPRFEHLVIDGISSDGSVEMLKRNSERPDWGHLRWISEHDAGQSDALNKGFRLASGSIIGWLNSDDRYRPECFCCVSRAFAAYPEADIIYGDYTWIDESGRLLQIRKEIEFSQFILNFHCMLYIPTTATFFRRRIFDDGNFLDPKFNCAMDYEFFMRLARRGYRFQHVPELLADFRWHPASKSQSLTARQIQEHDSIALQYSGLLLRIPEGNLRRIAFRTLRTAAAWLRYAKKLFRGYYFLGPRYSPTSRD